MRSYALRRVRSFCVHVFAVSRRQRSWRCLFGFSGVVWPLAGSCRRGRGFDRRCLAYVTGVGARRCRPVGGDGIRWGAIDLGVGVGVGLRAGEVLVAATAVLAGLSPGLDRRLGVAGFAEPEPLVDGPAVVPGDGVGEEHLDLGGLEEPGVVPADVDVLAVEGGVG